MIKNIQQQKLAQRFSPSQIQLMNMLAMPALVFEQYLANEIESNPALDADYTPETSSEDTPSDEAAGENTAGRTRPGEDRDDFDSGLHGRGRSAGFDAPTPNGTTCRRATAILSPQRSAQNTLSSTR